MLASLIVLLLNATPVIEPECPRWQEVQFDRIGRLVRLRTSDPQWLDGPAFSEDDIPSWRDQVACHRASIGLEPSGGAATRHTLGLMLVDAEGKSAGIATVRKSSTALELVVQRPTVSEAAARARVIGRPYLATVTYGTKDGRIPLGRHAPPNVLKTDTRSLRLTSNQVFSGARLLAEGDRVRLTFCLMAEIAPREFRGLIPLTATLEPGTDSPVLPLVIDAVTGETLLVHPPHCAY